MSEILINATPNETRVALVDKGLLQDVFIERTASQGIVANIYKGKVCRILPGMQAAFVEIGLARTAFLPAADISIPTGKIGEQKEAEIPPITSLLREGQHILVQVIKEPLGTKGARLSTQLSISSRYVVYMPDANGVGVSLKIDGEQERSRLKACLVSQLKQETGGYILRTAAKGVTEEALVDDLNYVHRMWENIQQQKPSAKLGQRLHEDVPLALRILRDIATNNIERIRIDSNEIYQRALTFSQSLIPEYTSRIEHYKNEQPLFDLFNIEADIQQALEPKIELKSGAYLIFDQTEAMTTVDVNTGGFVGYKNSAETILKTNLEAAHAIARQLRIRNVGGIIILDFIDMTDSEHRQQIVKTIKKAMTTDRAHHQIGSMSELGLVEISRKRTRESLEHILCVPCPCCTGKGYAKSSETVCYEIFREMMRKVKQYKDTPQFLVLAAQEVIDRLKGEYATHLAELEPFMAKDIVFQCEPQYTREQFNVVLT